jgi:hypothetical protein
MSAVYFLSGVSFLKKDEKGLLDEKKNGQKCHNSPWVRDIRKTFHIAQKWHSRMLRWKMLKIR